MTEAQKRPEPSPVNTGKHREYAPADLNPELALTEIAKGTIKDLGTPTVIKQNFSVWHGICRALQDGGVYDCSLRLQLYDHVAANSVNISGKYFERFWAFLMKPKYVIQGIPFGEKEEEKKNIIQRMFGWWRGGNSSDTNSNGN